MVEVADMKPMWHAAVSPRSIQLPLSGLRKRLALLSVAVVVIALIAPFRLNAQAAGVIAGTVTDKTGAAIPQAQVTITNQSTNEQRRLETDGAGEYNAPLLPPGTYSVLVEKQGFGSSLHKNIILSANTTSQANAQLAVSAKFSVTVTENTTLIQAQSTALVQVVDARRVEDLPLNGRNVLSLMAINAGVSTAGAVGDTKQIQNLDTNVVATVNGARGDETNFLLDDGDNNDYYAKVALPFPNPDAVREFSIQTGTYDARYGRAGGVVNVITRSGSNTVHGTIFEYVRNYDMNASNYFSGRDTLKRNQFGASLGGPLWIPKIYDGHNRTFLFFSYQGTRLSTSTPAKVFNTPSTAMKQGDFSAFLQPNGVGQIYNPDNGQPYANNQIPVAQFDPVAVKMLALMPASPGSGNYQVRLPTPTINTSNDEFIGRADQQLTAKQHVYGRVYQYLQNAPWSYVPSNLYIVSAGQKAEYRSITGNHSYVLTPHLLNSVNFTYNNAESDAVPPAELAARSLEGYGAKVMVLPNEPTLITNISGWSGFNIGQGYTQIQTNYELTELLNYSNGHHDLSMGGYFRAYEINKTAAFNSGGQITFNGQMDGVTGKTDSGNAFADFVLGRASAWIQQSSWSEDLTNKYTAMFVQDKWRVLPKVTATIGLRWDPETDYQEHEARKGATFLPGHQSTRFPNAPPGILYLGDPGVKNSIVQPNWKNFAPRLGLAVQVTPQTVVRAAYGIFYDLTTAEINNRVGAAQPFVNQISLVGPVQMSDPYNGGPELDPTPIAPSSSFVFSKYTPWALPATVMPTSYNEDWNLIVERQFGDTLLRVGYVGSHGVHLMRGLQVNPGIYTLTATASNLNSRRPYQPLGAITLGQDESSSNYNALQVTVQKRWSHGFSILANYTYSKSLDAVSSSNANVDSAGPDPFNPNLNYGPSDYDVTHSVAVSGLWQLPTIAGGARLLRETLGGWQTNYLVQAQTGLPDTAYSGVDNALSGVGGQWADLTGQPVSLSSGRSKTAKIAEWFNTAAFESNAKGTVGNAGRSSFRDPGFWNLNFSLFKTFPLVERLSLQFRAEAFNLFNHTNFGAPNDSVNSTIFGRINTAQDPRIMQLALRLSY